MNYSINHPPTTLNVGDTVTFAVHGNELVYTFGKTRKSGLPYLKLPGTERNRKVFDLLGIEGEEVLDFAGTAFGYEPTGEKWPRARANDTAALIRLIFALFGKIATAPEPAAEIPAPVAGVDTAACVAAIKALYTALTGRSLPS
jgi:hypothetical protein